MSTKRFVAPIAAAAVAVAGLSGAPPAPAASKSCGQAKRPYTDAPLLILASRGGISCKTARGVLLRYFRSEVTAFDKAKRVRYGPSTWRCTPLDSRGSNSWACTSGKKRAYAAE